MATPFAVDSSLHLDAFISYRRKDGTRIARRLRERLLGYKLPEPFKARERKLQIYLDRLYEEATEDFFEKTIKPALAASRALIVVQTPAAMEKRTDGKVTWVEREIRYFRSLPGLRPIWIALGIGTFEDPLPAALHTELPNAERVDLRSLGRTLGFLPEDELLKFIGPIYGVKHDEMPRLRREEQRRSYRIRRRNWAIVSFLLAAFLLLGTLATAGWLGATREVSRQRSLQLASQAVGVPSGELDLAFLLAAEALQSAETATARLLTSQLISSQARLVGFFHCPGAEYSSSLAYLKPEGLLVLACERTLLGWHLIDRREQFRLDMPEPPRILLSLEVLGIVVAAGENSLTMVDRDGTSTTVRSSHQRPIRHLFATASPTVVATEDWSGQYRFWRIDPSGGLRPASQVELLRADASRGGLPRGCHDQYEPAIRTSALTIHRPELRLIAFAMEDNGVVVNLNEHCEVLRGNTHNLAELKVLEDQPRLLLGSAGQIGRGRHGAVVWDLTQVSPLAQRLAPPSTQRDLEGAVAISDNGRIVAVHSSGVLRVFDMEKGTSLTLDFPEDVQKIRIAPNLSAFAILTRKGDLWQVHTSDSHLRRDALATRRGSFDLTYNAAGTLLAMTEAGVYNLTEGSRIDLTVDASNSIRCSFLAGDGTFAVVSTPEVAETVNLTTGLRHEYPLSRSGDTVSLSCNDSEIVAGRYLVRILQTYRPNPIEIIDLRNGHTRYLQNPYSRRSGLPTDLHRLAPGSRQSSFTVLSTVEVDRILTYELVTGRISMELRAEGIRDLAADADGRRLVTLGGDGLLLWNTDFETWATRLRELAGRALTPDERTVYVQ